MEKIKIKNRSGKVLNILLAVLILTTVSLSADGLGSFRSRFVAPGFISSAVRFAGVRFRNWQRIDSATHVFSQSCSLPVT